MTANPVQGPITSGMFNKRISFVFPQDVPDGQGGFTRTYVTVPGLESVPAKAELFTVSKKGEDSVIAQQISASHTEVFTIRWRPSQNISNSYWISFGTHILKIRSIGVPDEKNMTIQIQSEELQAQGSLHGGS
jgi:head-tail adaptor